MGDDRRVEAEESAVSEFSEDPTELTEEELTEKYRGLVKDTGLKILERFEVDIPLDDLMGWGWRGLLEAYRRFDPTRDNSFASFAFYRIRGAMYDGLRKSGWGTRGTACELRDNIFVNEHLESNHRSRADVPRAKTFADSVNYLDDMVGDCVVICLVQEQSQLETLSASVSAEQQKRMAQKDFAEALRVALHELDETAREVLMRYQLQNESMSEIADDMGYSKSWVSRANARAISTLRDLIFGTSTVDGMLSSDEPDDYL